MGQADTKNDSNGNVGHAEIRDLSGPDGSGSRRPASRSYRPKTGQISSQEADESRGALVSLADHAASPQTRGHATRVIYHAVQALRNASETALNAFALGEEAGINPKEMIRALRIEHSEWDDRLDDMMRISNLLDAMNARTSLDMLVLTDTPISGAVSKAEWAKSEGFLSAMAGRHIEANPYPYRSKLYHAWVAGLKEGVDSLKSAE